MGVPKGVRIGGRQKGTPNKITAQREAEVAASGLTPLQYMLDMLRDERAESDDRRWAATTAAPYVHPKLAATAITGGDGGAIEVEVVDSRELARRVALLLSRADSARE